MKYPRLWEWSFTILKQMFTCNYDKLSNTLTAQSHIAYRGVFRCYLISLADGPV